MLFSNTWCTVDKVWEITVLFSSKINWKLWFAAMVTGNGFLCEELFKMSTKEMYLKRVGGTTYRRVVVNFVLKT